MLSPFGLYGLSRLCGFSAIMFPVRDPVALVLPSTVLKCGIKHFDTTPIWPLLVGLPLECNSQIARAPGTGQLGDVLNSGDLRKLCQLSTQFAEK